MAAVLFAAPVELLISAITPLYSVVHCMGPADYYNNTWRIYYLAVVLVY